MIFKTKNFCCCASLRTGSFIILCLTMLFLFLIFVIGISYCVFTESQPNEIKILGMGLCLAIFAVVGYIPHQALSYFPAWGERYLFIEPNVKYVKYFAYYYCIFSLVIITCLGIGTMLCFVYFGDVSAIIIGIIIMDIVVPVVLFHFTSVLHSYYQSFLPRKHLMCNDSGTQTENENDTESEFSRRLQTGVSYNFLKSTTQSDESSTQSSDDV